MLSHTLGIEIKEKNAYAKYSQTFVFWSIKGVQSEVTMMNQTAISHSFLSFGEKMIQSYFSG